MPSMRIFCPTIPVAPSPNKSSLVVGPNTATFAPLVTFWVDIKFPSSTETFRTVSYDGSVPMMLVFVFVPVATTCLREDTSRTTPATLETWETMALASSTVRDWAPPRPALGPPKER